MIDENTIEEAVNKIKSYKDRILSFISDLVSINTTSSYNNEYDHVEEKIVGRIIDECDRLKLPYRLLTKREGRPNIYIGNIDSFPKRTDLLLVSHSDTVPVSDYQKWKSNPFHATTVGDFLYGLGTADCKGGIAICVYITRILFDLGFTNVKALIGVAEEVGADADFGVNYVLDEGLNAKYAIYTYAGKKNEIIIGHRGLLRYWINVEGESNHTGLLSWQERKKGENAIEILNRIISRIYKMKLNKKTHPNFSKYTFNHTVTLINGGNGESLVPSKANAMIDVRLLPGDEFEEYLHRVQNIIDKVLVDYPKGIAKIEIKNNIPAVCINEKNGIAKILNDVLKEDGIKDILLKASGAANEGYMLIEKGIPTICGFGFEGGEMHRENEYIKMDSMEEILLRFIKIAYRIN